MKTPDDTLIFVKPDEEKQIRVDQSECMGCLSQCGFSSWADNEKNSTGRLADPRSFCIQKTLQEIAHGGPVENNLMFAGHAAFRFKSDPFYSNGFIPTVKQLVDRILTGASVDFSVTLGVRFKQLQGQLDFRSCGNGFGAAFRVRFCPGREAAALLGVDRQRTGDDPYWPRPELSQRLALPTPRPAGASGQEISKLAPDPGSGRGSRLDAGDLPQRSPDGDRQTGRTSARPGRSE